MAAVRPLTLDTTFLGRRRYCLQPFKVHDRLQLDIALSGAWEHVFCTSGIRP